MLQVLIDGFVNGTVIALLASSFSIVYVPTRVFSFALGGVYALAPYVAWVFFHAGLPILLAGALGAAAGALVSVAFELLNHRRLDRLCAPPNSHLLSSLGLYIVLVSGVVLIWGNEPKSLDVGAVSVIEVADLSLTGAQLA